MRTGLAVAVLLWGFALPGGSTTRDIPAAGSDWLEVATPGFRLTSNVKERKTRELAEAFVGFQAALRSLQPGLRHEAPVPVQIFAFRSTRDYAPYRAVLGGGGEGITGHFYGHSWIHYIFLEAYPGRSDALPIIYHEYVHAHLANNFARLPLWLNEGLAEYFSTLERRAGSIVLGLPPHGALATLRESSFLPMTHLFAITERSSEYNERDRRGLYYAQSWLLVHFLLGEPDRSDLAGSFFRRLAEGEAADAALRETFGFGLDELERRLRAYVNSATLPVLKVPVESGEAQPSLVVESLPEAVALYRLGTYLGLAGHPDAVRHLEAATPAVPDAWATLGALAKEARVPGDPASYFQRAFANGAREALSHLLHARYLLGDSQGPAPEANVAAARTSLRRALELDPDFAEVRAWLGRAYLAGASPDPTEAVRQLRLALASLPGRADIAYNLGLAHLELGEHEEVLRLLDRVVTPGDPVLAERLRGDLARSRIVARVNQALSGGSGPEVETVLVAAIAEARDPRLRTELESRLREVRLEQRFTHLVDRYNDAVALANASRLRQAREELLAIREELSRLVGAPSLGMRAASFAVELAETLREIEEALREVGR